MTEIICRGNICKRSECICPGIKVQNRNLLERNLELGQGKINVYLEFVLQQTEVRKVFLTGGNNSKKYTTQGMVETG